jgi:phosphotransacetylase
VDDGVEKRAGDQAEEAHLLEILYRLGAAAGVVLGARVPIVLTSRADSAATRLASCALAALMSRAAGQG